MQELIKKWKKAIGVIDRYWNIKTAKFWRSPLGSIIAFLPFVCGLGLTCIGLLRLCQGFEVIVIIWYLSFTSFCIAWKLRRVTGFILKRPTIKGKMMKKVVAWIIKLLPDYQQPIADNAVKKHNKIKRNLGAISLITALLSTFFCLFEALYNTDPNAAIREFFSLPFVLNLGSVLYIIFIDDIAFSFLIDDYSIDATINKDSSTFVLKDEDTSIKFSTTESKTSGTVSNSDGSKIEMTADEEKIEVDIEE